MPIIVDEVVISIEVANAGGQGGAPPLAVTEQKQVLVAECVERVLEILRDRQER